MESYIIGVDGGGTKTHAVLFKDNKLIGESYSGAANIRSNLSLAIQSITQVIDELITKYGLMKADVAIGIGVAGFSVVEKREQLKQYLTERYANVVLSSDCHIACLAAHNAEDGAIVICGTGVVGYSIVANQGLQIGGWGFSHGDLGGGAWLGLEICKSMCKAIDQVIAWSPLLENAYQRFNTDANQYKSWLLNATPSDFAQLAKLLLQYQDSDANAQRIIIAGANEVQAYIHALHWQFPQLSIKLVGGLATIYLPYFKESLPDLEIANEAPAIGAYYLLKHFKL